MYIVSIICIFHGCLEDCACETLISILRSSFTWSLNEANLVNSNVHTHNFPLNFCKWNFFFMCIWNSERKKLGLFILVHWTRLKPGTRVLGSLSPTWDGHSLSLRCMARNFWSEGQLHITCQCSNNSNLTYCAAVPAFPVRLFMRLDWKESLDAISFGRTAYNGSQHLNLMLC